MIKDKCACIGCGLCEIVCSVKNIHMTLGEDGFYRSKIDGICRNCGLCERVCPLINYKTMNEPLAAYGVMSRQADVLARVSSGGAAYELARHCFMNGYSVCGVTMSDDNLDAQHIVCRDASDLDLTMGSKYIQSYTVDGFKAVISDRRLKIVFGTPCQIAAIDNYTTLLNKRGDFLLVDLFCHGTPSRWLWEEQLRELSKKYGEIRRVKTFRAKKYGWGKYCLETVSANGSKFFTEDEVLFYKFFLQSLCLNENCYDCNYMGSNSRADIRVGDYWGCKGNDAVDGVSCAIAFTQKGNELLHTVDRIKLESVQLQSVLKEQRTDRTKVPRIRNTVIKSLRNKKRLRVIYYSVVKPANILDRIIGIGARK